MKRVGLYKVPMALVLVTLVFFIGGCTQVTSSRENVQEELMIFAAASMTDGVSEIVKKYQSEHPEIHIVTNFAGSKTLRSQIENGAQPDLFISANEKHYKALMEEKLVDPGALLLTNSMVVAVSNESNTDIQALEDLIKPCQIVLAEEGVPAGDYARRILQNYADANETKFASQVMAQVVSEETNVRQVLMKVAMGEADAALVYRTDVTDAVKDQVRVIDIDDVYNVIGSYYICTLPQSSSEDKALYTYILGAQGDEILTKYGFKPVIEGE